MSEFQGSYSISFTKAALLTLAACAMVFIYDGLQVKLWSWSCMYNQGVIEDLLLLLGIIFF